MIIIMNGWTFKIERLFLLFVELLGYIVINFN